MGSLWFLTHNHVLLLLSTALITLNDEPITDEYFRSNKKYEYHEAGTTFEVIKKKRKEMITAKGPLTEAIILEVQTL